MGSEKPPAATEGHEKPPHIYQQGYPMGIDPDASLTARFHTPEMQAAYALLREQHRAVIDYQQFMELHGESAIHPDVITERGYICVGRDSNASTAARDLLKRVGIPSWATREDRFFPGLLIPLYNPHGDVISHLWKPRVPVPAPGGEGKKMKYAGVKGRSAVVDVHPRLSADRGQDDPTKLPLIRDTTVPLWITEGSKKADSLISRGICAVSLSGVYNWRSTLGTLPDWEDIPLKGRKVVVCFDADMAIKPQIRNAADRLRKWLRSRGADAKLVFLPPEVNGRPIKGVDDYFRAGGEAKKLLGMVDSRPPREPDYSSEADFAGLLAEDPIDGRYVYTNGLGWMRWIETRWAPADEEEVVETLRLHVLATLARLYSERRAAADDIKAAATLDKQIEGYLTLRSAGKLYAVLRLIRGVESVRRDASDFDADPDVLNTPSGLLHLETRILEPHSPDHLITRITTVDYDPTVESEIFKAILTSLPDGAEEYAKRRFGQAITGHTPDDDKMVMLTGGGGNGKSMLIGALSGALGDVEAGTGYAVAANPELLLTTSSKGAASPEKMDLRGGRFVYMEETPEDRYLSVTTVKQVVGTKVIKGRHLYKDIVAWRASHSLFLNTNFPPRVVETDDGSWRRLCRLDFPYRFRFDGDGKGERKELDRDGDVRVQRAVLTGDREMLAAALRWMVEGAQAWYEQPLSLTPAPTAVTEGLERWRAESDVLRAFLEARCEPDKDSYVTAEEFYAELKTWLTTQKSGTSGIPDLATVRARIAGHSGLGYEIAVKRLWTTKTTLGVSRASAGSAEWGSSPSALPAQVSAFTGIRFA